MLFRLLRYIAIKSPCSWAKIQGDKLTRKKLAKSTRKPLPPKRMAFIVRPKKSLINSPLSLECEVRTAMAAQKEETWEKSVEMERIGGRLITLPNEEFNALDEM